MQRAFSGPENRLAWEPHTSALSPAGQEEVGTYLTIWHRQAGGSWRAVFDTGIANTSR